VSVLKNIKPASQKILKLSYAQNFAMQAEPGRPFDFSQNLRSLKNLNTFVQRIYATNNRYRGFGFAPISANSHKVEQIMES
jgi:hypothetical protein